MTSRQLDNTAQNHTPPGNIRKARVSCEEELERTRPERGTYTAHEHPSAYAIFLQLQNNVEWMNALFSAKLEDGEPDLITGTPSAALLSGQWR